MTEPILNALARAEAVIIGDSPLLHFFPIMPDEEGNLEFTWLEDEAIEFKIIIPVNNLYNATVEPDGYHVKDKDGDEVALATYLLTPTWKKE